MSVETLYDVESDAFVCLYSQNDCMDVKLLHELTVHESEDLLFV